MSLWAKAQAAASAERKKKRGRPRKHYLPEGRGYDGPAYGGYGLTQHEIALVAAIESERAAIHDPVSSPTSGCEYFIRTYVRIEDRDAAVALVPGGTGTAGGVSGGGQAGAAGGTGTEGAEPGARTQGGVAGPTAPASTAPASTAPASTAPASTAPASTAPASTAPASTAPASTIDPTDPDADGIVIPFRLWERQTRALDTILRTRLTIMLKARQLGVTWLVLAYSVWRMITSPGYAVIALSKKETPDAKELVRRVRFILRHLPRWLIQEKAVASPTWTGPTWEDTVLTMKIHFPGQEPATFVSMASSPDAGRSLTSNLLILDEWAFQQWAEQIWDSAYPTINRPTGGQVIGLSTAKRVTLFERIWLAAAEYGFTKIFLPWYTDPRRDHAWREATRKALPSTWMQEYPETEAEAFSAGEATAFPEFSREIHVCRPFVIPSWWRRWRANDPGLADPFAWYWLAVSEDGIVYVYREYGRDEKDERVTYAGQAREVVKMSVVGSEVGQPEIGDDGEPVPERISFTVVGRDAFGKVGSGFSSTSTTPVRSEGKSIVDCYHEGGLTGCIPPPGNLQVARINRKAVVHEYLAPFFDDRVGRTVAKVQIFSTCTRLIEALPALLKDENDAEKVAVKPHIYTNPYDAFGYGLVAWHSKQSTPPPEKKTTIQRDKERLAKTRAAGGRRRVV